MLQVIDNQWKDHLLSMDELKQGIGLRGHGQKDPLVEYKKESYELFNAMMDRVEDESVRFLYFSAAPSSSGPVLPYPDEEAEGARVPMRRRPLPLPGQPRKRRSGPQNARWKTSPATSSVRKTRNWRDSISGATTPAGPKRWSAALRSAATILAPAGAARSIRSATGRRRKPAANFWPPVSGHRHRLAGPIERVL